MSEKDLSTSAPISRARPGVPARRRTSLSVLLPLTGLALLTLLYQWRDGFWRSYTDAFTPRSSPFSDLKEHCSGVSAIQAAEYHARQQKLAELLHSQDAIYVAEPGATASYYGNISQSVWYLSERPLLLIIAPIESNGTVNAEVSILTPKFEATRAKLLSIPSDDRITYFEWPEDSNPYEVAVKSVSKGRNYQRLFADDNMRTFVLDGLRDAAQGWQVQSAPSAVKSLRERKSKTELSILKCANEATLLALRAVQAQMKIGMRESEVKHLVDEALTAVGLRDHDGIVLFGENAALPHGSGNDRVLGKQDFALLDIGGTLHGYHSDLTRTFVLPESEIPATHLQAWFYVQDAQRAALAAATEGSITGSVDRAARAVIERHGYGDYFTHRLGHGIGLETHESPYLRGGSKDPIEAGNTFSDEPGIYVEGKFGVRLEDCFVVGEDGKAVLLTEDVGGFAESPWNP
ncbi:Creatinase/aminopeptidase [Sistotremastrum niveocremeum HHB9708]|uniref:Creatinase/aminopeptidase n=1 Tax=Sistotremastrum niveocremeum HHB9708 TaxID=1314777 RepID=A0A165AK75_9AGAM|nr:Creatinase/aminopeptidase [Sistotremastrum niveocremeum HHB9708]